MRNKVERMKLFVVWSIVLILALTGCGRASNSKPDSGVPTGAANDSSQSSQASGQSGGSSPAVTETYTPGVPTHNMAYWCYTDNVNTSWVPATTSTITTNANSGSNFQFVNAQGLFSSGLNSVCGYNVKDLSSGISYQLICTSSSHTNMVDNQTLIPGWTVQTNIVLFDGGLGFACNYSITKN